VNHARNAKQDRARDRRIERHRQGKRAEIRGGGCARRVDFRAANHDAIRFQFCIERNGRRRRVIEIHRERIVERHLQMVIVIAPVFDERDVRMADGGGFFLCHRIRVQFMEKRVPVIGTMHDSENSFPNRTLTFGANAVIIALYRQSIPSGGRHGRRN